MLGETSGLNLLQQNYEKNSCQFIPPTLCSRGAGQQSVAFSPSEFWLWEHLKAPVCSVPTESGHFHKRNFNVCETTHNRLETFEVVRHHVGIEEGDGRFEHLFRNVT
jgi:hypothetical protein